MPTVLPIIDTHVHFDLEDFLDDQYAAILRNHTGGFPHELLQILANKGTVPPEIRLEWMINPGISAISSQNAVRLAQKYPFIKAGVAIHPNYTAEVTEEEWLALEHLATNSESAPYIAAIGETGLDRHWDLSPIEIQKTWFRRHIELSQKTKLPLIIHCREAIDDLLPILREYYSTTGTVTGTIHSFSEGVEEAKELLKLGFYLGFTGSVTYTQKKFASLWEAAKIIPEDRLLLETDSPFLIPHPFRGKLERNEPVMSLYVARRLAELRNTTVSEIIRICTANAKRLFRLEQNFSAQ